jgi:hypothetical protein
MCNGLEGSWETRIPGYVKIRWLPQLEDKGPRARMVLG